VNLRDCAFNGSRRFQFVEGAVIPDTTERRHIHEARRGCIRVVKNLKGRRSRPSLLQALTDVRRCGNRARGAWSYHVQAKYV
jgi:hypothetical protein